MKKEELDKGCSQIEGEGKLATMLSELHSILTCTANAIPTTKLPQNESKKIGWNIPKKEDKKNISNHKTENKKIALSKRDNRVSK